MSSFEVDERMCPCIGMLVVRVVGKAGRDCCCFSGCSAFVRAHSCNRSCYTSLLLVGGISGR
jgi:hypothetical protein